jgi:hypothetical protein
MKDSESPRSGILDCGNGSASFYCNDFNFYIMNNFVKREDTYYPQDTFSLKTDNQFIHGLTHDGQSIAIFVGDTNTSSLTSVFELQTSAYLVQCSNRTDCNWDSFDSIEFCGGVLNNLFSYRNISVTYIPGGYTVKDDDYMLSDSIGTPYGNIEVDIGWYTAHNVNPKELTASQNTAYMRFIFEKPLSLEDIFKNIETARSLVKFMSYRDNVEFDSINLQKRYMLDTPDGTIEDFYNDAQVFIRNNFAPSQKRPIDSICFDDLGTHVFSLLHMLYEDKSHNPLHFLEFLPNSDEAAKWISSEHIREIATFIECETYQSSQKSDSKSKKLFDDSVRLKNLISKFKQTLYQDESENGTLPENVHQLLERKLNTIAFPSRDSDFCLYEAYKDITYNILPYCKKFLTANDTKEFRKYRNDETHGNYGLLNFNIGITGLYLVATGYCSILHRAGVDDATLKQLCNKHFLC